MIRERRSIPVEVRVNQRLTVRVKKGPGSTNDMQMKLACFNTPNFDTQDGRANICLSGLNMPVRIVRIVAGNRVAG